MKILKLKRTTDDVYPDGSIVTIRDDITIGNWSGVYTNGDMMDLAGQQFIIRNSWIDRDRMSNEYGNTNRLYSLRRKGEVASIGWDFTYLHFKESYHLEEGEEDEQTVPEIYEGMYLYHYAHDNPEDNNQLLFKVESFNNDIVRGRYIFHSFPSQYGIPIEEIFNTKYNISKGYEDKYKPNISKKNKIYLTSSLYIPDNDVLLERWGVSNKVISKEPEDGKLALPDYFKDLKYKPKYIRYTDKNNQFSNHNVIGYVNTAKTRIIIFEGNKPKTILPDLVLHQLTLKEEHLKTILKAWSNIGIKSIEQSVSLFGHNKRKSIMFEKANYKDPKERIKYKISNVLFNYKKDDTYYHVVEIHDGTLNLKFLLDELDVKISNIDSFIEPKDREIKIGVECRIVKDKLLPTSKGNTIKVIKVFNKHKPVKGKFDKNSVALVVDKNNKQFECKLKQLKRI